MNATLWPNKGDRAGGTGRDIAVTANSATHARAHICSLRYLADSCGCPGGVPPGARTAPGALSASSLQPVNPADPRAGGSVCVRISVRVRAPVCAVPPGRAELSRAGGERSPTGHTHIHALCLAHTKHAQPATLQQDPPPTVTPPKRLRQKSHADFQHQTQQNSSEESLDFMFHPHKIFDLLWRCRNVLRPAGLH